MDDVSLDEMIRQIHAWHVEVNNQRNDGWTQQAYRDRLETLHARVLNVMEAIRRPGQEENNQED